MHKTSVGMARVYWKREWIFDGRNPLRSAHAFYKPFPADSLQKKTKKKQQ